MEQLRPVEASLSPNWFISFSNIQMYLLYLWRRDSCLHKRRAVGFLGFITSSGIYFSGKRLFWLLAHRSWWFTLSKTFVLLKNSIPNLSLAPQLWFTGLWCPYYFWIKNSCFISPFGWGIGGGRRLDGSMTTTHWSSKKGASYPCDTYSGTAKRLGLSRRVRRLTLTAQDGVLHIRTDVCVEESTVLLQATGETSPWKHAEGGHSVGKKKKRKNERKLSKKTQMSLSHTDQRWHRAGEWWVELSVCECVSPV